MSLPPGIRPPETEVERFLRRCGVTPYEAYELGRLAAQRECQCGVRRGGDARGPGIIRESGYITRVY